MVKELISTAVRGIMMPRQMTFLTMALIGLCLLPPNSVFSQVELRFSPQDTSLVAGESAQLSIILDGDLDLRTIEVTVTYDPEIVESLNGGPGQGFIDTGCTLFENFDDTISGSWYGFAVILGAECWLTGPTELFTWDFLAVGPGQCEVSAVDIILYTPQAEVIEDINLPGASLTVVNDVSNVPSGFTGLDITSFPNPFNPSTTIAFRVDRETRVAVDIFAVDGTRVTTLADRLFSAGRHDLGWRGQNSRGRPMPSGTYFVHMRHDAGLSVHKILLAR